MNPERLRAIGRILRHRFVAVPLLVALAAGGWNIYVAANDDGIIAGTVRDSDGRPVADAEVVFLERDFVSFQEKLKTRTDAAGRYRFDNMQVHVGQVEARIADGRRSERRMLRLWFRAQNTEVAPLVIPAKRT